MMDSREPVPTDDASVAGADALRAEREAPVWGPYPGWEADQTRHLFATWSVQTQAARVPIADAAGARFRLPDGTWVYDLESQVYNVAVGHKHPWVIRRIIEQAHQLPAAAPNALLPVRARIARMLCERTGLAKVFLTTGGSEAVENAIKIARLVTGRRGVIARRNSYHGATLAVLEIAGDSRRDAFFSSPGLWIDDPFPHPPTVPGSPSVWLAATEELIERSGPREIAAVVLESLTGTCGMQTPPDDFWPGLRSLCDRHGILLIADEIFSGFGRTGRTFAIEHWGVRPDLLTFGKGLTSGYAALAGVAVSEAIAESFDHRRLDCGLTHYAHPIACAAGVGSMEVLDDEGLVARAAEVGAHLASNLSSLIGGARGVLGLRGRGLMLGLQLDRPVVPVIEELWRRAVFAPGRGDMLFVCPPLCLSIDEADEILNRISDSLPVR